MYQTVERHTFKTDHHGEFAEPRIRHEGRYRFGVHCGHDAILATRVVPFDSSKYEAFLLQDPRAGFFNESERVPRVGRYTGIGAHNSRLADKLFAPAL